MRLSETKNLVFALARWVSETLVVKEGEGGPTPEENFS